MKRIKLAVKNFLSESLPEIIIALLGLIRIKFFLTYLGSDVLGLYQLYGQLFAYLTLAEAGFSTGALYSLYKPLAAKDQERTNQILAGISYIFKLIGVVIIVSGVALSFFVTFFIKGYVFDFSYVQTTFLLFLVLNSIQYFFMSYGVIFDAEQSRYVRNYFYQGGLLLKTTIELILLALGCNLYLLLISSIIVLSISNISMYFWAKKRIHNLTCT